jgi:hypothetical protein
MMVSINRVDICQDSAAELQGLFQSWLDASAFKKINQNYGVGLVQIKRFKS